MERMDCYPADHPVLIGIGAVVEALRHGREPTLADLRASAEERGVAFGSDAFDRAAAIAGLPYSRSWDLYVPLDTWAEIEIADLLA